MEVTDKIGMENMTTSLTLENLSEKIEVLIESTRSFERDLEQLGQEEKTTVIQKINDCVALFSHQKDDVDLNLHHRPLLLNLNGYESSLYTLKVSQKLRVICAVDEDPIFGQVIFTLFRVVQKDNLDKAYKSIADSLYQELQHHHRESI